MSDDVRKRLVELSAGCYIEEDVLDVVGRIQDYDSNLRIKFLDPKVGGIADAPYAIFEVCPDGLERLVFTVWELDERVMDRLFRADTYKHDILAGIEQANQKARNNLQRRFKDTMEEAHDITKHVVKSPKTEYSIPSQDGDSSKVTVIHSHEPSRTVPVRK